MSSRHLQSRSQPVASPQSIVTTPGPGLRTIPPLPSYIKPSHPLTPAAQQKLRELDSGRNANAVGEYSSKATAYITDTAGVMNDQLRERTEMIERRRKKWAKGQHLEEQEGEEEYLRQLQRTVDDMTTQLEKSMRDAIDDSEAARRMRDSLNWLRENALRQMEQEFVVQRTQRQQTQSQTQQQDGSSPGPTPLNQERIALTGLGPMLTERLERKTNEYYQFSHNARYAKNNDYIGFKGTVHDARYGDDVPLPHADTWFDEGGRPAPGITTTQTSFNNDDDIVIDKANISTRCPITFQQFKEPFTSKKCPHTFEKSAILTYIRQHRHGVVSCPVTGCDEYISAADLHVDLVLVRKIKRIQEAETRVAEDSESEEDEEAPSHKYPQNRE